jgi:NAD(P)H-flavin reductase
MSTTLVQPPPMIKAAVDPMIPRPAVIEAVWPEAYGISTFALRFCDDSEAESYRFAPGQFNMISLPHYGESAISVSSDPSTTSTIAHTIRFAGQVTRALARLKAGDHVGMRGPFGHGWPIERAVGKDLLIVAGGIGLAPLRPVIYEVIRRRNEFNRAILLYGARTPADLLYTDQFEAWQRKGIEIHVTVDRADESWKGQVGVVPLLFYRVRLDEKQTVVFTCGPEVMMRFVIYEAVARRVPREEIWVSLERNMKCAVGFCGHCQFGPHFICKDGPVLGFPAIESFLLKEEF